ncbi:Uncharacterised protein [Corynebacterium renale]|uniref:hypothetical protein n=1 Tax=Corynebacterium renale TaxID=1724 RepID=UPI000DA2DF91|nr:hypothetical protein [Corynebacterium renale]SQG64019.1 Uncharacterised protein [Corynebacterium renale]
MDNLDPTRIPTILGILQEAWEGQSDLTLAQLWGVLENQGISWGSSDADIAAVLKELVRRHPARVSSHGSDMYSVELNSLREGSYSGSLVVSPEQRTVVVNRDTGTVPVAWKYSGQPLIQRSRPVRITDRDGNVHVLGIAGLITAYSQPTFVLNGLLQRNRAGGSWLIELADGSSVFVGGKLRIAYKENRSLSLVERTWHFLETVEIGKPLRIDGEVYADVEAVWPVSFPRVLD